MADQFASVLTPPPSKPSTAPRSRQLEAMIRRISENLAMLAEHERESVKAELAARAREWCLKDISHDLRTPLNAIIGFTQLMENGTFGAVGNPQYLEYLRHIRESGYDLLDKVEGLIDSVAPTESAQTVNMMGDLESESHQSNYRTNVFKEAVA